MGKWVRITGILLVLGVAAYVFYDHALKGHKKALEESLERDRAAWQTESERLEREITELQEELALKQEAKLPAEKLHEVFGAEVPDVAPEKAPIGCDALERKVREFFDYLDGKNYIRAHRLEKGTLEYFRTLAGKLSDHPPAVSAEFKDPFLLMHNVAHFYRVLGKKGLRVTLDVIVNESEIAEPVGALLFEWFSSAERCPDGLNARPSPGTLYEYAGFFLNSVGGRSYLLRRDSRVRILTTYYSVLMLDRANEDGLNRHGVDIRPHIDSVLEEVRNHRGLVYQKEYIDRLADLKEQYAPTTDPQDQGY